jgi:iron complex outermembrane receptor protein
MVTPFNPTKKASLGIQYEIPLGIAGRVTPRLDVDHTDSYYSQAFNAVSNEVPSHTLLNAHLRWQSLNEQWQAMLEVSNVTDKLYYHNKLDYSTSFGSVMGQPGKPRAWALMLKRNFK